MNLKRGLLLMGALVALGFSLSFIHPWGNFRTAPANGVMLSGVEVPAEVLETLNNKCADCHSERTRWPIYSRLAPASWLVERDVFEGRQHLDFSNWAGYDTDAQIDLMAKIARVTRKNEMPVRQYLWIHPAARLTDRERQMLIDWARREGRHLQATASQN
jgi:cytochrome c